MRNFEAWMEAVDASVQKRSGMSVHDLADQPFRDWFDSRVAPSSAAWRALREEGF